MLQLLLLLLLSATMARLVFVPDPWGREKELEIEREVSEGTYC